MREVCEVTCIHEDKVNYVQERLNQQNPSDVAKVFKALSDDTRVKIAYALTLEDSNSIAPFTPVEELRISRIS